MLEKYIVFIHIGPVRSITAYEEMDEKLVLVIGMLGVQLQINHESLPKERKILSECEARGQNLVILVMTSD